MQLHSVLFGNSENYERMARVLEVSAAENSPATPLTIHRFDDHQEFAARDTAKKTWSDNTQKAYRHAGIIRNATDGEVVGLLDADSMVLGDLSPVESMEFDIAYTVRPPQCKWKLNTGVYFVRVSPEMKRFCGEWFNKTLDMLSDQRLHREWKVERHYGGIHQAAFGWMIENSSEDFGALALPCEEWNCVNGCYDTADNPRVVHLMRYSMRRWCLDGWKAPSPNAQWLADRWKEYDARVNAGVCRA